MTDEPRIETRLAHLPALDGVRGLLVIIVLLYHHSITWMTGGELTVSVFFTLSGFLITRLIVAEWDNSGKISLRSFYERRARRLLPSSFVVMLAVVVVWTLFPGSGRRLAQWEWFSGLAYFENVYLQSAGKSYGGLFGLGNPLQHLWSLSLEEQVYLIFPVLCLSLLSRRRTTRRTIWKLFVVLTTLAIGAIALGAYYRTHPPLWSRLPVLTARCSDSSCVYYATEVRVGEFLMGAAFAVLWSAWRQVPLIIETLRKPLFVVSSWPLVVGAFIVWFKIGWQNQWSDVFFPWAVFFNGLITLLIIAQAATGSGMCSFLSWKPLAWLGQLGYTIYLVHWPMFLIWESFRLDPNLPRIRVPGTDWVTIDHFWMFIAKAGSTMLVVCLIYYLLENPVRQRKLWQGKKLFIYLALMALVGTVIAFAGNTHRSRADDVMSTLSEEALAMQQKALADLPELPANPPDVSTVDAELPARIMMVGDSQSWVLATGLDDWEETNQVTVQPSPGVGCGIGKNTPIKYLGVEQDFRSGCTEWRDSLGPIVQKFRANLVIVVGGTADLSDRKIPGVDGWSHVGEPNYDAWLLKQFTNFIDVMSSAGSQIVWLSTPNINPPYISGETGVPPFDEADPSRSARYNELIQQFAETDDRVVYADFASAVKAHPGGEFESKMRPDGAHIDLKYAPELVTWLDQMIRDVYVLP
jgi:peptidoglycan/LPS O-acetylase OafA/YrhL